MERHKTEQTSRFDGSNLNRAPIIVYSGDKRQLGIDSESDEQSETSSISSMLQRQDIRKRPKVSSNVSGTTKVECFFAAVYNNLSQEISSVLSNDNKLQKTKGKLLNRRSLPNNIYPAAAKMAGCTKDEMKDYFVKEPGIKLAKNYWNEFAEANFDTIVEDFNRPSSSSSISQLSHIDFSCVGSAADIQMIKQRILDGSHDNESENSSIATSSQMSGIEEQQFSFDQSITGTSSQMSGIEFQVSQGQESTSDPAITSQGSTNTTLTDKKSDSNKPEHRSFHVPLSHILRKELGNDLDSLVHSKFNDALKNASDHMLEFQYLIFSMMLAIKNIRFVKGGDGHIDLESSNGFRVADILPSDFQTQENIEYSSNVIPSDILTSEALCEELNVLFDKSHLQRIDTVFFSTREGINQSRLVEGLNAIVLSTINRSIKDKINAYPDSRHNNITLYSTNLNNMWSKRKLMNKLMDKLLVALLRVHLAPKREGERRKTIEKKKVQATKEDDIEISRHTSGEAKFEKLSRDTQRNILRREHYLRKKYATKAQEQPEKPKWLDRVNASLDRIEKFKGQIKKREKKDGNGEEKEESLKPHELFEEEDANEDNSGDVSSRRLGCLKACMKTLLFKFPGKNITEEALKDLINDATEREVQVCLLIMNCISPYIPSKENSSLLIHQLPFVLLANDILRCAGYQSFTRDVCPLSSTSMLHGLRLDAASLYSLMCVEKPKVHIFDSDGYVIPNKSQAREAKDFVFSSFFDIEVITKCCDRYKLNFDHNITLLPGLQEAVILGTKKKPTKSSSRDDNRSTNHLNKETLDDISIQRGKSDAVLTKEIKKLDVTIKKLTKELKDATKAFGQADYGKQIKDAKKTWIRRNDRELSEEDAKKNESTYDNIKDLKAERYEGIQELQRIRTTLSGSRYEQFIRRKAKAIDSKKPSTPSIKSKVTDKPFGIGNASNMVLDKEKTDKYIFSGTDNGIVKMTETAPFDLERFQYHIELFNRYSPLADLNAQNEATTPEFIPLPESFTISPGDIDLGSGHMRLRRSLEKDKKVTAGGRAVLKIEKELGKSSLRKAVSAQDAEQAHIKQLEHQKQLQEFYFSKKRAKKKRRNRRNAKEFKEKLCAKERKHCRPEKIVHVQRKTGGEERKKKLIMFIGDKGTGVGSSIKGHRRYGGKWHSELHGRATNVCITNEDFTSQICPYCFHHLVNAKRRTKKDGKTKLTTTHGAFVCFNPHCVSVKNHQATQTRDSISALSIGLNGLSTILLNARIPSYTRYNVSHSYTEFKSITTAFFTRSAGRAARDSS